ncbi:hypothetical protein UB31_13225 [Bradyrhizobium sp. LTSP849]|nr:hypothetical protein UB31_13225 [Bradyrhizobium sp. LTSP849]
MRPSTLRHRRRLAKFFSRVINPIFSSAEIHIERHSSPRPLARYLQRDPAVFKRRLGSIRASTAA